MKTPILCIIIVLSAWMYTSCRDARDCSMKTVQATVQAHTHNQASSDITILVDNDGNTYERRHHLGNIGSVIPIQKRVCTPITEDSHAISDS